MQDSERAYIDLIYSASKKYANWDPEVSVEVGDWGRITAGRSGLAFWNRRKGIFLKEGNIYKDGLAEQYSIPKPDEYGLEATEGMAWILSNNVRECDFESAVGGQVAPFAQCSLKAGFQIESGRGAILVMENDTISTIDPPGALRRLLKAEGMKNRVVVSQVHRCSSYARHLTSESSKSVAFGLKVQPPITGTAEISSEAKWVTSSVTGNFKAKVNDKGERNFYPLFRLVSIKEQDLSSGFRGAPIEEPEDGDDELDSIPLPDAVPPWREDAEKGEAQMSGKSKVADKVTSTVGSSTVFQWLLRRGARPNADPVQ